MKIQELKAEVRSSWETLNLTDGTPTDEALYKAELRKFGDLRCKSTWERAAISLEARWILGGLENRDIIHYFCAPDTPVGMVYNQAVLDELLLDSSALGRIKNGLESLYRSPWRAEDGEHAMSFLKRISGYQEGSVDPSLSAIALTAA